MSENQAKKLRRAAQIAAELKKRKLLNFRPYPKQAEFHAAGSDPDLRYRCIFAGNQEGKTEAGAVEVTYHLTGLYPPDWEGLRFDRPVRVIYGSESGSTTRDTAQVKLFGEEGQLGTGYLPKHTILKVVSAKGTTGLYESATIKHVSGGESKLFQRSYDQGRKKWASLSNIDFAWPDEEPPWDIWEEMITRLNAGNDGKGGHAILTATPLLGMSKVVEQFYPTAKSRLYNLTLMGLNDIPPWPVGHLTEEGRQAVIDKYEGSFDKEARLNGIPSLGSGRVFAVGEDTITCDAFEIPPHWHHVVGIDFGWDHPTAAVHMVIDRDHDEYYIVNAYRQSRTVIPIHASTIKQWGPHPVAWPHDGYTHDKGSGDEIAGSYRREGVKMLGAHATHPSGGYGTEAGVQELLEVMKAGRFKVFAHLREWFEEFQRYHRKEGKIVKEADDLMSATRMAWMMRRAAKQPNPAPIELARKGRYDPMAVALRGGGRPNPRPGVFH